MAFSYREFGITARRRRVAQGSGSTILMPGTGADAAICGVIDLTTESYSELSITSRDFRNTSQEYGGSLFTPSFNGSASVCEVFDIATGSRSEFSIAGARSFSVSTKSGSDMVLTNLSASTYIGVVDMAGGSYSELTVTSRSSRTPLAAGSKVFIPCAGTTVCEVVSGGSVSTITIPDRSGWFPGGSIGDLAYFINREGPNPSPTWRMAVFDASDDSLTETLVPSISGTADAPHGNASNGDIVINGVIYWPSNDVIWYYDPATSTFTGTAVSPGRDLRSAGYFYNDALYMPTNGISGTDRAYCGVLEGLIVAPVVGGIYVDGAVHVA